MLFTLPGNHEEIFYIFNQFISIENCGTITQVLKVAEYSTYRSNAKVKSRASIEETNIRINEKGK